MKLLVLLALPLFAFAAESKVTFIKLFKGAVPEYFEFAVTQSGASVYKESPTDDQPVEFQMSAEDAATLLGLVEKIDHCKHPLESGLKVANLGAKTLRCEDAEGKREVTFNYSTDPAGQAIADFFEKLSETQQHLFSLERTVRFDKLGVNKTLLQLESSWDRNRIVGAERFIPLLQRVAKNDSYLNMARDRADKLIIQFQTPRKPDKDPAASSEGSSKQ